MCYCNLIGGALDLFMTHFGEDRRGSEGNTAVGKDKSTCVSMKGGERRGRKAGSCDRDF